MVGVVLMQEEAFLICNVAFDIGSLAVQAMLYEVSCFPSPGLVSPTSNGAHRDMNYYTFIDSTVALNKYFARFTQAGMSEKNYKEVFSKIRVIGQEAEAEMFAKTNGINTHKGMLFLMAVSCAAVGKVIYEKRNFHDIPSIIRKMTKGIVDNELKPLKEGSDLSHGERLFLKYNSKGIRGEVEKGIPTVFEYGLKAYNTCGDLSINDRLIHTLISIMQICDDTTILHRHSPQVLQEVREGAKEIINIGGMKTSEGRAKINIMCDEYIKKNISPGGSADLLGVTVFFNLVEEYMKKTT